MPDDRFARAARTALAAAGLAAFIAAAPASAHHANVMFDLTRTVKLSGTVDEFDWAQPHVYIELDVPGAHGVATRYSIECNAPGVLLHAGWTRGMIKRGDKLSVVVAPLKTGGPQGFLRDLILADGRTFNNGAALYQLRFDQPRRVAYGQD